MKCTIRRVSLRTKIIASSFVPTAIILLAVALVMFYAYQRVTADLVINRNQELTRLSASQLAVDLKNYTDLLTNLSRVADIYQNNPTAQAGVLKQLSNRLIIFDAGVVILNHLGRVAASYPERPDLVGQEWSNRAYFRQMVRTKDAVFSDILADGPGGTDVMAIAVPILTDQGEFQGTLVGMFRLGATSISAFYGGIVKLRIAESDNTYLVDSTGRVIYHTDVDRIGSKANGLPVIQYALNRQVGALRTTNLDGQEILASYAPVPGTPWVLITEEMWPTLLASSQGYGQFLLLLLALGIFVPALVVMVGVNRITEPIAKLIVAAQEIAGGEFEQQITVRTGDELEELVHEFNLMAAQLQESYTALQEREERLDLVIQATNDGIWDWNLQTGEVYYSPRWKRMLGYESHELPNRLDTWWNLIHPDDLKMVQGEVNTYLEGRTPAYQIEHRLRHKDGSYRWILAQGHALRDPEGTAYRMAGSHTDITERKQAQNALQVAYQTLERRVAERTDELATLNAIATAVSRSLDLEEILGNALEKTLETVGMETGVAYRFEASTQNLVLMVHRGLSDEFVRGVEQLPLETVLAGKSAGEDEPLVREITEYPDGELKQQMLHEGLQVMVGFPLMIKERLLGGIAVMSRSPRPLVEEKLSRMVAIGRQVAMAVENARLYKAEQDRHEEAERRRQVAEALRDVLTMVNSSRSLDEILDYITAQASRLLGSDAIALYRLDRKEGLLRIHASRGLESDYIAGMIIPVGRGAVGQAVLKREPVAILDIAAVSANPADLEMLPQQEVLLEKLISRYCSLLTVPLIIKDEAYGAIALYYQSSHEFTEEETALAVTFGDQAALAIENAGLRAQAARSAVAAERDRMARELHDSVTQSLYSVTLYAEAAARLLANGKGLEAADHLRELRDTAQEALREMRLLIFELRPLALEKGGLIAALRARLDAVEVRGGMQAALQVEGAVDTEVLPVTVQEELYHIAQEALNNVVKHANARCVRVRLQFDAVAAHLEVCDDGTGFVPGQNGGGFGLSTMKERTRRIGGKFQIESTPGKGTTVSVEVPFQELVGQAPAWQTFGEG